MSQKSLKYNSAFQVCFSVSHDCEDPHDLSSIELVAALLVRINDILLVDRKEAFELLDTYRHQSVSN